MPNEVTIVRSFIDKEQKLELFNEQEIEFYNQLINEKQIFNEEAKIHIDNMLYNHYNELQNSSIENELTFAIQLTKDCNMSCSYCYQKKLTAKNSDIISTEMIDNILLFIEMSAEKINKKILPSKIKFTGGEPLLNDETVRIINYAANKWPDAKLFIQTNGINIIKYLHSLPLEKIDCFSVSLDGIPETHMNRRFSTKTDSAVYSAIIEGIKHLLKMGIKVGISSILDKSNYMEIPIFKNFLNSEGLDNPLLEMSYGVVLDYTNELGIDPEFNNKDDVLKISKFANRVLFPSLGLLPMMLKREHKTFKEPEFWRCKVRKFEALYFSTNGNVYTCDCLDENKGVIGSYHPNLTFNDEYVNNLINANPIFTNEKCKYCEYKYVCLGGCPLMAEIQNKDIICGAFGDKDIIDNFSYPYRPKH